MGMHFPEFSRRTALKHLSAAVLAATFARNFAAEGGSERKMTINLMPGMIGVRGNQRELIELAHAHGFESVEPLGSELARMSEAEIKELIKTMRDKHVAFGAAGLSVDFRGEESKFEEGLRELPKIGDALKRAQVTRMGTWIMPGHNSLTHLQNLKQHGKRLRQIADVLGERNIRLGLEYVGTKTLRDRFHYEFVHTMAETKELIAEIGAKNVGFVLDSWHWWNANETDQDILTLKAEQIVACDLNDAPAGIPKEKQMDGQRELPLATGVIPVESFLKALQKLGYDGPVRAEPFNKPLNDLENEEACARTADAMQRAFALIKA
jgi:sugar phosphate isomerase/epimerase